MDDAEQRKLLAYYAMFTAHASSVNELKDILTRVGKLPAAGPQPPPSEK